MLSACSLLLLPLAWAGTEAYLGADAVLRQAEPPAVQTSSDPTADLVRPWLKDVGDYQGRVESLSLEEAARDWLALFDRACQLPVQTPRFVPSGAKLRSLFFIRVFQALPPPATWEGLAAQIAARPEPAVGSKDFTVSALRVLAAVLGGKPAEVQAAVAALGKQVDALGENIRQNPF